jgi:hypothetical protein
VIVVLRNSVECHIVTDKQELIRKKTSVTNRRNNRKTKHT